MAWVYMNLVKVLQFTRVILPWPGSCVDVYFLHLPPPGHKDSVLCGFPSVNPPSSRFLYIFSECTKNCRLFTEGSHWVLLHLPFQSSQPCIPSLWLPHSRRGAEQHIPSIVPSLAICPAPRPFVSSPFTLVIFTRYFLFQRNTIPFLREFLVPEITFSLHPYKNIITLLKWKK